MIHFVALFNDVFQSKEWDELTHAEQLIYIRLKANYDGKNNGEIPFPYHLVQRKKLDKGQAKGRFTPATISAALKGLEKKGWITKTTHGGLYRYKCLYKLTLKYDHLLPGKKRRKNFT